MASSEGKRRWQELLQELQQELERQSARLEHLEKRDEGRAAGISAPMKTRSLSLKNWGSEHAGFSAGSRISNSASLRVSSSLRRATMSVIWQTRSGTIGTTSKYKPWYVVNPDTFFYGVIWKYVITASALYVALITPLQACTMELEMSFFLVFGFLVDAVFIIDLVLQFFVQITVHTSVGLKRVNSLRRIALHYLQSWFFCDLLVAIPFDLLGVFTLDIEGRTVRILWMLKLFRLLKTSRWWHLIEVPYSIKHQQEWLLLRFLGLLLLLCHWFACLWCLSLHVDNNEASWRDAINLEREEYGMEQLTGYQTYVLAYYFCSYTMTSVGYGDMGPQNELEVLLCICMVICTGFCWAYVLGQICAIVAGINEESQAFRMRMNNLNVMMQTEDLPESLQKRLRTFFLQKRNLAQHQHNLNLLNSMSPQLQSEVCFTSSLPWLRKVSFFNQFIQYFESIEDQGLPADSYRACLAEMSRRLECYAFAQDETFETAQVLCILSKGLCMIDSVLQHKGDVWGEDFILLDRALIRCKRCHALTYIEVLHLSRESLMEIIEEKRYSCPKLGEMVHGFRRRLAARRAILLEAKMRRMKQPGEDGEVKKELI